MSWKWEFLDAAGDPTEPVSVAVDQTFPTQSDAETWLGEDWQLLSGAGVAAVVLLEDARVVYGPMALSIPGRQ